MEQLSIPPSQWIDSVTISLIPPSPGSKIPFHQSLCIPQGRGGGVLCCTLGGGVPRCWHRVMIISYFPDDYWLISGQCASPSIVCLQHLWHVRAVRNLLGLQSDLSWWTWTLWTLHQKVSLQSACPSSSLLPPPLPLPLPPLSSCLTLCWFICNDKQAFSISRNFCCDCGNAKFGDMKCKLYPVGNADGNLAQVMVFV